MLLSKSNQVFVYLFLWNSRFNNLDVLELGLFLVDYLLDLEGEGLARPQISLKLAEPSVI